MRLIFMIFLILLFSVNVYAEQYYFSSIVYSYGDLEHISTFVDDGFDENTDGNYKATLYSISGSELHTHNFEIQTTFLFENFEETPQAVLDDLDVLQFAIITPYHEEGQKIVVSKDKEILLTIPVQQFAKTCGNHVCDKHESYLRCPTDCSSGEKDFYCDNIEDGICDPDCLSSDNDCKENPSFQSEKIDTSGIKFLPIMLAALILLGVIMHVMGKIKK